MSGVPPLVRAVVVCPACRSDLIDAPEGLACEACALLYPVVDGVPWLIAERARRWRPCASST
jgi:uncharacterized protein YbaR (Trm112 family)